MRTLVVVLLLLAAPVHGEPLDLAPHGRVPLAAQRDEARKVRDGGIVTLVTAALLTAVGAVAVANGVAADRQNRDEVFVDMPAGATLLVGGGIGLITGSALVAAGQHALDHPRAPRLAVSVTGLAVRF